MALYHPLCLWGVSPSEWGWSGECGDRTEWQCSRLLTCLEAHVSPFSDASAAMFSDKLETSQLPTHPDVALQTGPADGQRALFCRELETALFSLDLGNRRGQKGKLGQPCICVAEGTGGSERQRGALFQGRLLSPWVSVSSFLI